jgi:hypothetical protein
VGCRFRFRRLSSFARNLLRRREVAPAHRARPVRVQPHVDALGVEQVPARRQPPHHVAGLHVLQADGAHVGVPSLRVGAFALVCERRQCAERDLRQPEPALSQCRVTLRAHRVVLPGSPARASWLRRRRPAPGRRTRTPTVAASVQNRSSVAVPRAVPDPPALSSASAVVAVAAGPCGQQQARHGHAKLRSLASWRPAAWLAIDFAGPSRCAVPLGAP